ncbi:DUF6531 domain-containing protein [Streptomyces sp. NPDC001553]|uniref:DUF6531 domain-containing protein n=1 Tax=Streptomyces sp. NPDC001553 TaxID=3154385 RepID=UPI0033195D91
MAVTVPDWADTLLDLIGVAWPNVDEDAYRAMADSLREFAEDLLDDGQLANNHVERLLSASKGESIEALNKHWNTVKTKHFKDIAEAARTIAGAMDMAAGAVEGMKYAALVQLGYLAAEAGIALSLIPVTAGLSALFGAAAMRLTQEVVKRLIKECVEEAVGYIVSAMTEPAVAALEGMAADLVVQLGSMALGFQDGVDLDQTKNAGKDGFNDGVKSGKEALHLASAGSAGAGGGTGLTDLHIEHAEHTRAGTSLNSVSTNIHGKTTSHLAKAKSHHGRTRGRDSIAQAVDPMADKAMAALVKATKAMGDHVGSTLPKAVELISTGHKKNDDAIHDSFNRLKKNGSDRSGKARGGTGGVDHHKSEADIRTKPDALRGARDDPRRNSIPLNGKTCKTDPIDVATGEMNLPQTDLSLPGTLPLTLIRTHLSGYRYGQWFGRSWASTLDERLESDPLGGGLIWAREDGSLLVYPRFPQAGGDPVLPLEGPRLPLSYSEEVDSRTTLRICDPQNGTSRYFTGSPYSASPAYWLTEIEDRNGNGITVARGDDGAPATVSHDGGYQVRVATSRGRVDTLELRTSAAPVIVMTYGYDIRGNLNAVINSSGLPLTFTYDDHDRITSWTDRNNSAFRYVYDGVGRVVETIGSDGYMSSSFAYDTANRVTRYTDATGATTTFQLNELLQVVATTDPLDHTTHTAYDAYDRLLSQTDSLGRTTTVEYDETGRPAALIRADGHRTTATYNSLGLPATLTEPDGATWQHAYDDRGNRTALTDPAGATVTYAYNGRGALTSVTDPLNQTVRIGRTPAGLVASLTDPAESVTTHTYDAFGRLATLADPLGSTTCLTWSVEGFLTSRSGPNGDTERWAYDGEGNCTAHTDALGQVTTSEYTHFDLPAARTTSDGVRHTFNHDSELRLTTVTNSQGLTWNYTYDAAGQLVSETDFDRRTITYAYDPSGLLSTRVNAMGQNTGYSYDDVGNLVEKTVAGRPVRYAHDPCGRLIRAVGEDSVLEYDYDAVGRVVGESIDGRAVTTTCDAAGRRTGRATPSGNVTAYTYDTAGHRATLTTAGRTLTFTRNPVGREVERTLAGVFTLTHAYDPAGRPNAQILTSTGSPLPLERREYAYGPDGRLNAVTDQRAGRRSFTLDTTGRVTAVDAAGWSERYAYDEAGNQTYASWPDTLPATEARGDRSYTGTRITRAGFVRYEYDLQGRVILRQKTRLSRKPDTWRYTWDAEDRLTEVTTPDGARWRYRYDPLGRRIAKQRLSPDGTGIAEETLFAWDGTTLAEQTTRVAGSPEELTLTWDHDGYRPVAQAERKSLAAAPQDVIDQRFFAIVTDQIGTPTELVDESGRIAWHSRSTLWGTTVWNRDATAHTPLRFPGQYFDAETELHHNYFRHYDPGTARYLTLDPMGLDPAPNPSTYVDNPHTLCDPLGLRPCDETDPTWGGLVSYSTGPGGRAGTMHASIRPHMTGGKTRPRVRGGVAGWESGKGYNRTHLLGAQIGGSNKDPRNFVTMHAYANTPVMVHIENQIRDAVDRGETIEYTVTPIYRSNNATDLIPVGLTLEVNGSRGFQFRPYEGQDFKSDIITILNVPKR